MKKRIKYELILGIILLLLIIACEKVFAVSLEDQLNNYEEIIKFRTDEISLNNAVDYINSLYCVDKISYKKNNNLIEMNLTYLESKEDLIKLRYQLEVIKAETVGFSDFEKVLYVMQRLAETLHYQDGTEKYLFSPVTLVKEGAGVCQAYARIVEKTLNYLGMDCGFIEGELNTTPHLWNYVKVDNKFYSIDLTSSDNDDLNKLNFDYILNGIEDLNKLKYTINRYVDDGKLINIPMSVSKHINLSSSEASMGLISPKYNCIYFQKINDSVLVKKDYITNIVSVVGKVKDYWVCSNELFLVYETENDIVSMSDKNVYFKALVEEDKIKSYNGVLLVNNEIILNTSPIQDVNKVFVIKGKFKIKGVKLPYYIEENKYKINIFENGLFKKQIIKL